ncbi:hypothetical protein MSG28_005204 [Choristoneura fumiferana]|uniref:Uncharacterized protein n=1 Tax=Choristoneura fumiferana TaxID=7141 RepID=A0ACC0JQA9_CHOFU|nr:hypothetical protein MSG28_005204 [Choristoneura fumiferana]
MRSMVVLFALASVACGSLLPLAQPPHHPALVLDPHGRPLDTAEVIGARALHLQAKALEHHAPLVHASRVDVISSPAVVSHAVHGAPVLAHAAPLLGAHSLGYSAHGLAAHGLAGHGHWLKKRSLGHYALATPVYAHAPSAVSHQSRVDVVSSPAVVSHAVHAAPVLAHAVHTPVVAHAIAPAAVSHQSRVDVHSSPAVVSHSVLAAPVHSVVAAPLHSAHSLVGAHSLIGAHSLLGAHSGLSHGHWLKKRSLFSWAPVAHSVPAAVSHQSRVDVISSPAVVSHAVHAAPVVAHAAPLIAHAAPVVAHVAPSAVSHQSRVDVISSPTHVSHVAPLAHSAVWTAPLSTLSHHGLLHSAPLAHAAHW